MTPTPSPIAWHTRDIVAALALSPARDLPDHLFSGISTDSRTLTADTLFVALKGERFDGHNFVPALTDQGIRGAVVTKAFIHTLPAREQSRLHQKGFSLFGVDDTLKALGKLAAFQRRRARARVIAITGSCGKTTTREMTVAILGQKWCVLSTQGNLNNEVGLPLTLLSLSQDHDWAVVEMGMNHPGEIHRLAAMAAPDIGVITNTFRAHLEGLGSLSAVARAKAELIPWIAEGGILVLNREDSRAPLMADLAREHQKSICFFSTQGKGIVNGRHITPKPDRVDFTLETRNPPLTGTTQISLATPAPFMVENALAAASAGLWAGVDHDHIQRGLTRFTPVEGRLKIIPLARDIQLINDTYNANPDSTAAALYMLSLQAGPTLAVLGDMLELGKEAPHLHRETGRRAAAAGLSHLFCFGDLSRHIIEGAIDAGFPRDRTFMGSRQALIEKIHAVLTPGMWVLVKGSRGMQMEKISRALETLAGKGN